MREMPRSPALPTVESLLSPGRNCWRVERARRVSFLVDGEAYFQAFAEALERAQRRVILAVNLFETQVEGVIDDPQPLRLLFLAGLLALIVLGIAWTRRTFRSLTKDAA